MSKYGLGNSEGVKINNQLYVNDSLEFTNNDLEGIIDFVGGAGVIVIDSSIETPFSFAIQDELLNNFLSINGTNGNITVYNLLEYDSDPTVRVDWGNLSVPTKAYVDSEILSAVGGNNQLSEILINGNTSGSTDIYIDNGQKLRTPSIEFDSSVTNTIMTDSNSSAGISFNLFGDDDITISPDLGNDDSSFLTMARTYVNLGYEVDSKLGSQILLQDGITRIIYNRETPSGGGDKSIVIETGDNTGGSYSPVSTQDAGVVFVGGINGTGNSGVTNSVIVGGTGIAATSGNTLFTQNFETKALTLKVDDDNNEVTVYNGEKLRKKTPQTLTSGATITWDMDSGANANLTLGTNGTVDITNVESGDYGTIIITQDATGSRTITFGNINGGAGTHVSVSGGLGSITLTSTGSAVDILSYYYDGTSVHWSAGYDYT